MNNRPTFDVRPAQVSFGNRVVTGTAALGDCGLALYNWIEPASS